VLLDEEPTNVEQIGRIVKKRLAKNPLLIVSVKAHPKTDYSDYIRVLDQLKIANAKKISIANSN
jgi:biopolymer transport protein ExbD